MQVKVSDILADISSKNEIVNFQVNKLSERLWALENEVFGLPKLLTEVMKIELAKHKSEMIELLSTKQHQQSRASNELSGSKDKLFQRSKQQIAEPSCSAVE